MKHTMKKLLCMALAIMLLVSAVPVFAAAASTTRDVLITVEIDGSQYFSGSEKVAIGDSVASITAGHMPDGMGTIYTYSDGYLVNGKSESPDYAVNESTSTVTVRLRTYTKDITVVKGTQSKTMNLKVTAPVTVGTGLLTSVGMYIGDNEQIAYWTVNGSRVEAGAQFTAKDVTNVTCVVTEKTPSVGTITVKFSVDGGNEATKQISANSKTVSELISLGGYSAYALDKAGLGGSGTKRDVNSLSATINAGETVYIKMKTPTTPSNPATPANPSTPTTSSWINFVVKVDSSSNVVYDGGKAPANGSSAKIGDLIKNLYDSNWASKYDFDHAWSSKNQAKITDVNATVYAGDTVTVMLNTKPNTTGGILNLIVNVNDSLYKSYAIADFTQDTINNLLKAKLGSNWADTYSYNNTVVGGITYNNADVIVKAGQTATVSLSRKYSKDNSNKVYLHVYLNGDASTIALTKDITGTYLMDDWSTDTTEILKYLKNNYYTAKDTSEAITIDGLYTNTNTNGAFPGNYYADNKVPRLDKIRDKLEEGYVHISVMLKNAKAKTSATADSSNPKTGDTIFVPVMVMGVTATALAAAYVFGKKRIAR